MTITSLSVNSSVPRGLLELILLATEDGRQWGLKFLCDPRWGGDRDRMANHAIYEATLWSVGSGVATGAMGWVGLPLDIAYFYYAQIKLAAALFTIHGLDTKDETVLMILIPAALGMSAAELANSFSTQLCVQVLKTFGQRAAKQNLPNVLMSVLQRLPRPLFQRIVGNVSRKGLMLPARAIPLISSVIGGTTNAVIMNICGHGVCAVIKTFRSPAIS